MARIFTPSERTRRNTNPQPVQTSRRQIIRSRYLVILKNIVGAPVPFLWICFTFSLFVGLPVVNWVCFAIAAFTAFYIVLDRFSLSPEFRFFRLGIEIPLGFLLMVHFGSNLANGADFFTAESSSLFSWFGLLYLMTYSLNLFPGLNRYFISFLLAGSCYVILSIAQVMGIFDSSWFLPKLNIPDQSFYGLSFNAKTHAALLANLLLYCMSFFVYKRKLISLTSLFFALVAIASFYALGISKEPLALVATIVPFCFFSFFISRKWLKNLAILGLIAGALYFGYENYPEVTDQVISQQKLAEADLEKDYWRSQFENQENSFWLGKPHSWIFQSSKAIPSSESELFQLESNFYLFLITQKGILFFLFFFLIIVSSLFLSIRLLADVPSTHNWHKVFGMYLISAQIFLFIYSLELRFWSSGQASALLLGVYSLVLYMVEAYGRQIVPDDKSL